MDAHARSLLETGAAELGLALDASQVERLLALLDLVVEWNQKFNLTAITEPVAPSPTTATRRERSLASA